MTYLWSSRAQCQVSPLRGLGRPHSGQGHNAAEGAALARGPRCADTDPVCSHARGRAGPPSRAAFLRRVSKTEHGPAPLDPQSVQAGVHYIPQTCARPEMEIGPGLSRAHSESY